MVIFTPGGGYVIIGVYVTRDFWVLALSLLLLAPIISFRGYPLYPITTFFSILVKFTQFRYYLYYYLFHFRI